MEPTAQDKSGAGSGAGPPAPLPPSMEQVLKEEFGFSAFRPNQRAVLDAVLAGRDCFTLMATGAGKSLCYQFVSVYRRRLAAAAAPDAPPRRSCTIVVSPLLSLIQNQVDALPRGVLGVGLTSDMRDPAVARDAVAGAYHIVYVTPERIAGPWQGTLRGMAARGLIDLVAVDESHCLTEEHQILTSKGFMYLRELEANTASDLLICGYDHASKQLVYERCSALIVNPAQERTVIDITHQDE